MSTFLCLTPGWSHSKPWAQLIISSSLAAAAAAGSAFLSYLKATCTALMNNARSKGNSSSPSCKKAVQMSRNELKLDCRRISGGSIKASVP